MSHATLMDENFPSRIEAVFPDRVSAQAAARALCQRFEFDQAQLSLVSAKHPPPAVHRNRYAFKASGRRLQWRQMAATLIAFGLIILGLVLLQLLGDSFLPESATSVILGGLIFVAVVITVIGLVSWRPVRVETQRRVRGEETALVIHVRDLSEQYALREALLGMGAAVEGGTSASVS